MIYHQRHNKRQNTLASIKHLTPLLLPVNKGSKAIEQGKTQSQQPPPIETLATMRFKPHSVERRRNLRTKRVCLDKSICRRPLPLYSLIQTVSVRKKRNARFYSRWGGATEHIQLHIRVSGINVNFVPERYKENTSRLALSGFTCFAGRLFSYIKFSFRR